MGEIAKFILFIGPCSSVFDYVTYALMWFVFGCGNLRLAPPPEVAAHFTHASLSNPDSTYAAALFQTALVRRIFVDPDSHYPCTVPAQPGELAANHDFGGNHAIRLVAFVPDGTMAGYGSPPGPLLAPAAGDAIGLCSAHPVGEDVAGPKEVDLRPNLLLRDSAKALSLATNVGVRGGQCGDTSCVGVAGDADLR